MKLIVLDVDGVLSGGESHAFDLSLLERLADLNRRARRDNRVPAVTLNTGRPSPYVEAVMQAIDGWQPALYESGAGLYFPDNYRFQTSPRLTHDQMATLHTIIDTVDRQLVQSGRAYWQPGKTVCHTLFTHSPLTITDIMDEVNHMVTNLSEQFIVTPAIQTLNIHPVHVNKGTGLEWLAQEIGIEMSEMGGVGDSVGDLDFLRLVGHSAAPANATADVKTVVRYISPQMTAVGVHDILDHWQIR